MDKVKDIKRQILALSRDERAELGGWFAMEEMLDWGTLFEADVRAGGLDALGAAAKRAHAAGETSKR